MRLTLRQRFDFGRDTALVGPDLVRPESWDALRIRSSGPFALAATQDELVIRSSSDTRLVERARSIVEVVAALDVSRVASYGVGTAAVEVLLGRAGLEMSLTEYAPLTVERLRALFPGLRVETHDLLLDRPLEGVDVHLFHRIDTDFTDPEWRDIFSRFERVPLIFVAAGLVTPRVLARQLLLRLRGRGTPSGWIRTRGGLCALWSTTHDARARRFADLPGWVLRP